MAVPIAVGADRQYSVARDGRFLMNVVVEAPQVPPITVVLNWDAALKPWPWAVCPLVPLPIPAPTLHTKCRPLPAERPECGLPRVD